MGADSLAENTQNAPQIFGPICLPKPKSLGFSKKQLSLGVRSPWSKLLHLCIRGVGTTIYRHDNVCFLNTPELLWPTASSKCQLLK